GVEGEEPRRDLADRDAAVGTGVGLGEELLIVARPLTPASRTLSPLRGARALGARALSRLRERVAEGRVRALGLELHQPSRHTRCGLQRIGEALGDSFFHYQA